MKWLIASVVCVAAVFLVLDTAFAIQCYKCNSYFQQDCADWFDNRTFHLEKCGKNVTMCRKVVQEIYYNDEWNVRYIRQCAPSGEVGEEEGRKCVERTGTNKIKMRYCHCNNQDGCNGASNLNIPTIMMAVPALTTIGLLFRKL